jgi:hypothetical protein
MRTKLLAASALLSLSASPAFAGCIDLVAELEGVIAASPAMVSEGELVNMTQMLEVGSGMCEAGDEAGATEMLNQALAIAGS